MSVRKLGRLYRRWISNSFCKKLGSVGENVFIEKGFKVINPSYIHVGRGCYIGPDCRIEAWDRYNENTFHPQIVLGENVKINSTCHIGAIGELKIGKDTLLGSHVLIIDHSHGKNTKAELLIHPSNRDLFSKGPIVIGERCWLAENVVVLPNVHIGNGCVVGANSVVTKDIPDNCVAVGNPAHVIKIISDETECH